MSRFLGSYKRLKRRIEKCQADRLGGEIGPALAEYAWTGELPLNPGLRAQIKRIEATVQAMAQTMPGPGPVEDKR